MGRRSLWLMASAMGAGAVWILAVAWRIHVQSSLDESRPADVIVVLGAAEYHGRPSPVLKARLDHAFRLYQRRLAPRLLTTGGAGGDPLYTEAGVGRSYLIGLGVPSEAIIVEREGDSTAYSVAATGEIMRRLGLRSCIVVSDGYHIFRAKRMLEGKGLTVFGSPRPQQSRRNWAEWWACFRQAVGYGLWSFGLRI